MARPKGSKNKKTGITYPRKCNECEYEANNPASYSYHIKTHLPIPENKTCHFGCGDKASYITTHGKFICKEQYFDCPAYLSQLSERTKKSWIGADDRKKQTKKLFEREVVYNKKSRNKSINSIKEKAILMPKDAKDYRSYARKCRKLAQQWAKENGYSLGVKGNHVDHKLSVMSCYNLGVDIDIANHPENLRVINYKDNVAKGSHDIISHSELLESIKKYKT